MAEVNQQMAGLQENWLLPPKINKLDHLNPEIDGEIAYHQTF